MQNRKAQLTLFIIVGILLVAVILFILFLYKTPDIVNNPSKNPEGFIDKCVSDSIKKEEQTILNSNGYPDSAFKNYLLYNQKKIPYLCVVSEFYSPCIPQEPGLMNYIQNQIEIKVARSTENCFTTLVSSLEKTGYSVEKKNTVLNLSIKQGRITAEIKKDLVFKKEDVQTTPK